MNKDAVYSDGTIAISGTTVTGTGTTFNTAGLISAGDVLLYVFIKVKQSLLV